MKRKYLAIMLGMTLAASMIAGCGASASSTTAGSTVASASQSEDSQTVYGQVTAVDENKITIQVGTLKEMDQGQGGGDMQKPEDASANGQAGDGAATGGQAGDDTSANSQTSDDTASNSQTSDDTASNSQTSDDTASTSSTDSTEADSADGGQTGAPAEGGQPQGQMPDGQGGDMSMLDLTDEEKEIEITDSTEIVRQSMGGGQPGGNQPGGGQPGGDGQTPPEMQGGDGQTSTDGQTGTDGQASTDGQTGTDNQANGDSQTPPEKPEGDQAGGDGQNTDGQTPPEMPSGDQAGGNGQGTDGQTPPEKPEGDQAGGDGQSADGQTNSDSQTPPEMQDGGQMGGDGANTEEEISLEDISEGDTVMITLADDGTAEKITVIGGGQMGGDSASEVVYSALEEFTEDTDIDGKTYDSTTADTEGLLTSADATVNLNNVTVNRTSEDSTGGDNSSFYGVGAAILGTAGTTNITNSTITTDSAGGAGVFAYGDAVVNVSDTTISTKKDTSGGIHAAGGGTLYATNVTATTEGESSAAIRSDRGGGKMVVDGGSFTSNGTGSPAIYSTADIAVNNASLTANNSEAICIEGLNSIHLFDCDLSGNMPESDQNDCDWNVILYQSMSGDAEEGNSTFEMDGGTLTANNGGMFYTTNTESTFVLDDVDINYADENDFFLKCTGNSNQRGWGSAGANGADSSFTAIEQEMSGDVIWDSISDLDFYMSQGSSLTGAIVDDESNAGNGGDGYCNVYIDADSQWIVTGDSTLTKLENAGTIKDAQGNTVTIQGTDGTVYVEGSSQYTITVSEYADSTSMDGISTTTSFADYQ